MTTFVWTLTAVMFIGACADDTASTDSEDESHELSPGAEFEADACVHMVQGPVQVVPAAPDAMVAGPDLSATHTRYDITLPAAGAVFRGYGQHASTEARELGFALDRTVSLTLIDPRAHTLVQPVEVRAGSGRCAEVTSIYLFDVGIGTYVLGFESPSEATLRLVIAPAEEGHGDE